jgi:hypothetical protein
MTIVQKYRKEKRREKFEKIRTRNSHKREISRQLEPRIYSRAVHAVKVG